MALKINKAGVVTGYRPKKGETAVTVPEGVTAIADSAFAFCDGIESVTLPGTLETIGASAFLSCKALKEIVIPETVRQIGGGAFLKTPWLEARRAENPLVQVNGILIDARTASGAVEIPAGIRAIAGSAFAMSAVTAVTVPEGITEIPVNTFNACDRLTAVYLPQSVRVIGDAAFFKCGALTAVTLPDTPEAVGINAFGCCTALRTVQFSGGVLELPAHDGGEILMGVFSPQNAKDLTLDLLAPALVDYFRLTKSAQAVEFLKRHLADAAAELRAAGDEERLAVLLALNG